MGYSAEVLADSPLAFWKLDEAAGASTFADASGNARSLTKSGTVTFEQPAAAAGITGSSIALAGAGGGYVSAPSYLTSLTAFSVEFWAKWTGTSQYFLVNRDNVGQSPSVSERVWTMFSSSDGKMHWEAFNTSGTVFACVSGAAVNDGVWHHFVCTFTAGAMKMYVDGLLSATQTLTGTLQSGVDTGNGTWFSIGAACNNGANNYGFMTGGLDAVSVYGAALSPTRAAVHYIYGAILSYAAAVLANAPEVYLKLDELSGSVMADSSGHGRDGIYSGGVLNQTALMAGSSRSVLGTGSGLGVGYIPSATWMNNAVYSVEFWVKPNNASDIVGLVSRFQGFAAGAWLFWQRSGQLRFLVETSGAQFDLGGPAFSVGTVYHLVGTYDGTTQRFYVNGVLNASQAVAGAGAGSFIQDLQLGGYGSSNLSAASLDDVSVYGTVLSDSNVLLNYNAGLAGLTPPVNNPPPSIFRSRRAALLRASTR